MLFELYKTLEEANATNLSQIFVYMNDVIPFFWAGILFAVGIIAGLGTYFAQQRVRGFADFWSCFAVASFFVAVLSIIMSLIPNMLNPMITGLCIIIAVVGVGITLSQE